MPMKSELEFDLDQTIKTRGLFTKFIGKCKSSYSYGYASQYGGW
jgi:hypothetical protein